MISIEGENSIILAGAARIIEDSRDCAWAEKFVHHNPMYKWILGKYVEADNANYNRQYWSLSELRGAKESLRHAPLNILHQPKRVVGNFVEADLIHPTGEEEAAIANPYLEALAVYWRYYFPDEFGEIENAYANGSLYYSMECVADSITEIFDDGTEGETFDYRGPRHQSYSEAILTGEAARRFNGTKFLGGALIIPPEKPGWGRAEITDVSALIAEINADVDASMAQLENESPHLNRASWEFIMNEVIRMAAISGR